jgi:hypothetical protein
MAAAHARATLLLAAQVARIADAIEQQNTRSDIFNVNRQ